MQLNRICFTVALLLGVAPNIFVGCAINSSTDLSQGSSQENSEPSRLLVGDVVAGEAVYIQCTGCHSPERHRTGPKHCGIAGRTAGHFSDFDYSEAMRKSTIVWNQKTLNQFLKSPLEFLPGTSMGYAGLSNDQDRKNLVAYLLQLNESATICDGLAQ